MNGNLTKQVTKDVACALAEDVGSGDLSALLLSPESQLAAHIISRDEGVLSGSAWADATFKALSSEVTLRWHVFDGESISKGRVLCDITGPARAVLTAERVALNFLQTLSATATRTRQYVALLEGTACQLLDTRKTLPGLRLAQKYATRCGGAKNHRLGLYDAIMIKENHIRACGSISIAVKRARKISGSAWVEVEVETLAELTEALSAEPDVIMLDNFSPDLLVEAVSLRGAERSIKLEASGNVNLQTVRQVAHTGVDYISVGDITKSIQAIDLSLLVQDVL